MKPKTDQARVVAVRKLWIGVCRAFDRLPLDVRNELGGLIEANNTGEWPPGKVIDHAFKVWLEGGRV